MTMDEEQKQPDFSKVRIRRISAQKTFTLSEHDLGMFAWIRNKISAFRYDVEVLRKSLEVFVCLYTAVKEEGKDLLLRDKDDTLVNCNALFDIGHMPESGDSGPKLPQPNA